MEESETFSSSESVAGEHFADRLKGLLGRWLGNGGFRRKVGFFRRVYLFQDLSRHSLSALVPLIMEKSYAKGEIIFQEGDVGRACFIVARGRVEILRGGKTIATVGPGEFFGEMVLLDELPRSATARSLETSSLYILYKSQFDGLLKHSPRAASRVLYNLSRLLSARLRRQNSVKIADLSTEITG